MPDTLTTATIAPTDSLALPAADTVATHDAGTVATFALPEPGQLPEPVTHIGPADADDLALPFLTLEDTPLPQATGINGTPLPYSFATDDGLTIALLLCFALTAAVMHRSWRYFRASLRTVFGLVPQKSTAAESTESERGGVAFLLLQTLFAAGIVVYDYLRQVHPTAGTDAPPYAAIGLIMAAGAAFIAVKTLLYATVNATFFDRTARSRFHVLYLFTTTAMGLLLLPVALLVVYFDLAFSAQAVCSLCIIGVAKIVLLLGTRATFFAYRGGWLHIILYFCALEIIPAISLWRFLLWADVTMTEFL